MAFALKKEKLETYRKQLTARRDKISAGLSRATQELLNEETLFTDTIDQASAEVDRAMTMQMKDRERANLILVNEALRRIEDGSFGTCERCEEKISEARIKAFPLTTLCIDCKAELESEGHRYPSR